MSFISDHLLKRWNVDIAKISAVTGRNVFITLIVLRNGRQRAIMGKMFDMNRTSFERFNVGCIKTSCINLFDAGSNMQTSCISLL